MQQLPQNERFAVVSFAPTGHRVEGQPSVDIVIQSKESGEKRVLPECTGLNIEDFDDADFQYCEMVN